MLLRVLLRKSASRLVRIATSEQGSHLAHNFYTDLVNIGGVAPTSETPLGGRAAAATVASRTRVLRRRPRRAPADPAGTPGAVVSNTWRADRATSNPGYWLPRSPSLIGRLILGDLGVLAPAVAS